MSKKLTTQQFIDKANIKHNHKFNYRLVEYTTNSVKVKIICPKHGLFQQVPLSHLYGIGCKTCGIEARSSKQSLTQNIFVKRANIVHENNYNYSLVKYKSAHSKVNIICNKCNKTFSQAAYSHLKGHGCPKCNLGSLTGWTKSQWIALCNSKSTTPLVYIIRCYNDDEEFIKIGRTSRSTQLRFNRTQTMPYSYEIIKEFKGSADFVYDKEHELHKLYKKFKYKPLIEFGGKTECFNISILQDILKH